MYMYIDSLCCTPETKINVVKQPYSNKKLILKNLKIRLLLK